MKALIAFSNEDIGMLPFGYGSKCQCVGIILTMVFAVSPVWSQSATSPAKGRALEPVLEEKLSVLDGKVLTAQIVHYPPGGSSKSHYHDADVFAFVLSGKIRSQTEGGGEAKVYNVGEGRFERRGQHHVVSENASATEPASMLVVFIHNPGATLTTFDR
jgi:quercetin dioxygenase-like cupin family protein